MQALSRTSFLSSRCLNPASVSMSIKFRCSGANVGTLGSMSRSYSFACPGRGSTGVARSSGLGKPNSSLKRPINPNPSKKHASWTHSSSQYHQRSTNSSNNQRIWMGLGGGSILAGLYGGYLHTSSTPLSTTSNPSFIITSPSLHSTIVASSPSEPPSPILSTTTPSLLHTYILEPISTLLRFFHLAFLFGPVILTYPMIYIGSKEGGRRKWRRRRNVGGKEEESGEKWGAVWWYGFLVKQMERAGPTFIKLGQWAASRADLFPSSLCEQMGKLHSNGKPHPFSHTQKSIEDVFLMPFDQVFEEFERDPIGCGAIAQVYRARLKRELMPKEFLALRESHENDQKDSETDVNTSVAIKILHPRVESTIRRDLAIMNVFAKALNLLPGMEWLSFPEEVEVFGHMMNSQLDLRVEGNNLDRFAVNFRDRGASCTFPRPIRLGLLQQQDQSQGQGQGSNGHLIGDKAKGVLVEEFEDALPLKYFLRNGGGEFDDRIANIGLDAFLNMLLIDNWTHGDLHPGNIMVRFYKPSTRDFFNTLFSRLFHTEKTDDSILSSEAMSIVNRLRSVSHDQSAWLSELDLLHSQGYEPQLILIDAGLVTSLNTENRKNFLDLFQAVAEFDGYKAGQLMVERCRTPDLAIDKETFALKMQDLVLSVKSKTFSLAAIKISDILTDVLTSVREHHVKMEGDFVNTVISILLLEGIGRQLDPNMDLFKSALPILRQLGRQMGTKEAIKNVQAGNIWAMAKIWVWLEAREIAGSSSVESMDNMIKLDQFTPNV